MKISCLGGAGYYFLRPIVDFCLCKDLHGSTVTIYDLDHERSQLMAETGKRLSQQANARLKFVVAKTLKSAVAGSDFVLTSIGGAGASGAAGYYHSPLHNGDKLICARHGIPQIVGDTAGPAAMMAAFRSIPIHLEICRCMEKHAKNAVFLNHANPMAVLCRAMNKYSAVQAIIGICHGVQGGIGHVAKILEVNPDELDCIWIGTNHYYWFTRIRHHGRDLLPELWRRVRNMQPAPGKQMSAELSLIYQHWIVYPEDDHVIEFYPYLAQASGPDSLPYALSQNEFIREMKPSYDNTQTLDDIRRQDATASRREMLKDYTTHLEKTVLPEQQEGGYTGEATAALIADIACGRRNLYISNVPNQGAVENLPSYAVLELQTVSDTLGVRPLCSGPAPPVLEAILRKRITWQELVVEAAVNGDKNLALQAMQVDECAIPPDRSQKLLNALLHHNRDYLPSFK